jgi:predicted hydrocarbon binding protein
MLESLYPLGPLSRFWLMNARSGKPVVSLPSSALTLLSRRCSELGSDGVRAMREAGYRAGADLYAELDGAPERLPAPAFWRAVDGSIGRLGWGSVSFETVGPGVGAVVWEGSPEADGPGSSSPRARCHLAAGLLGGLLSRAAGRTVAVYEARCRAGEGGPCWFLLGGRDHLREVHKSAIAGSLRSVLAP